MALFSFTAVLFGLLVIFTWRARRRRRELLSSVRVITLRDFTSTYLGNRRDIFVLLPPGYDHEVDRRYNVLYVNDGQEIEALGLRETLARLTAAGKIQPILVVAIPTNADRLHEYGTADMPSGRGLGARASEYESFVVEELMPLIDREFRTLSPAAFTGVSLGGLSAFDIVWNHPDLFNRVAVMSGSFWWNTANSMDWGPDDPRIAHARVRAGVYRADFQGWFQAGTRDEVCDRDNDGVIDAIQDTRELIDALVSLGFQRDTDLRYVEIPGGRHDYETWQKVLPDMLIWAFRRGSSPPAKK